MKTRLSGRSGFLAAAGIATVLLGGSVAAYLCRQPSAPAQKPPEVATTKPNDALPPSLDCSFTAFMHSSTAVFFYFDVEVPKGEPPRFFQRAFVSADGVRQNYEPAERPAWTYALDGDGRPMITSADGATHIVLYDLKLGASGSLPVEAGIRSNVFRNLGGQCRQTNLDGKGA